VSYKEKNKICAYLFALAKMFRLLKKRHNCIQESAVGIVYNMLAIAMIAFLMQGRFPDSKIATIIECCQRYGLLIAESQ
jgi:hypothetical protein